MYSVNAALHKDKPNADVEENCRKARMFGRKVRLFKSQYYMIRVPSP